MSIIILPWQADQQLDVTAKRVNLNGKRVAMCYRTSLSKRHFCRSNELICTRIGAANSLEEVKEIADGILLSAGYRLLHSMYDSML